MTKQMRDLLAGVAIAGFLATAAAPAMAQGFVVQIAPPPVQVETPPPLPGPAAIWAWRPGHWRWNGAQYVWVRGHYARRVHPGAVWIAGHWAARPGGYVWVAGHWR
jgi:hypothetical protein